MRFLHSVSAQDQLIAADGTQVLDLPVNPLSVVCIGIRPLNDTGTLSNFCRAMGLANALTRVNLMHRGASIVNASGRDLMALNYFRHGALPWEANGDDTDNERRCIMLPLILGRFAYDSLSCFPATVRGELSLELTWDIAATGYDGIRMSLETVELLGAKPREYERKTTMSRTFPATGFQDFDLINGQVCRGLLLFGTTPFGGASPAPSWGRVEVLKDGEQYGYASSDFEMAHQLGQLMGRQPPTGQFHTHRVDATAASATQETGGPIDEGAGGEGWENYAFLDFDPTRDDTFSVDTAGSSNFLIRANVETADAVRVVQVERISV